MALAAVVRREVETRRVEVPDHRGIDWHRMPAVAWGRTRVAWVVWSRTLEVAWGRTVEVEWGHRMGVARPA